MSTPPNASRFVIVPHRPRARALVVALVVAWVVTLYAAFEVTRRFAVPDVDRAMSELTQAREAVAELEARVERLRQRNAVARRSDEVSRAANQSLQETLAQRDEEISALRADVAFYERLVGGSSQRQGLTVHSLDLSPTGDGAWRYTLTLTQNLKKGGMSRGGVTLRVDGVQQGKLTTLAWTDLLQSQAASPQEFAFRYFQQLEGSVMLPDGFTPHRVRVQVSSDGRQSEQVFPWQATQAQGVS